MYRISNKDTIFTKLGILIGGPIVYIAITIGEIIFSIKVENYWTPGIIIWHILFTSSIAALIEYAINLKIVYIDNNSILVKGIIRSEKLPISEIKRIRSHRLFLFRINRPLVITLKDRGIFGKKIYIYPTITDKNNKINFLEGIETKEHIRKLLDINKGTVTNKTF